MLLICTGLHLVKYYLITLYILVMLFARQSFRVKISGMKFKQRFIIINLMATQIKNDLREKTSDHIVSIC